MKRYRLLLFKLFFLGEITAFLYFYVHGSQGLVVVTMLKNQTADIVSTISMLHQECDQLERQRMRWDQCAYFKEKIAREQLQMARSDEHVYYLVK